MATVSLTTALKIILPRIKAKSVLLATVNNTVDVSQAGQLNDGIRVYIDPITKVQTRTYEDTPVVDEDGNVITSPEPRESYIRDRLVNSYIPIFLNTELYAAFEANGWDTIDFADEQAQNYGTFTAQLADQIAGDIDTRLATAINAVTSIAKVVTSKTSADIATDVLNLIAEQIDDLDQAGVPGEPVILINPALARKVQILIEKYEFSGDSENLALRANILGRLYGAVVVKSAKISANSFVVYTQDAFVVATRPSGKASGAKSSETVRSTDGGIALTANLSFDSGIQADVVVVKTFAKVGDLDSAHRARKVTVTFTPASS